MNSVLKITACCLVLVLTLPTTAIALNNEGTADRLIVRYIDMANHW